MTQTLNSSSLQKIIDGDICWLQQQRRTLERDHIEMVLRSFCKDRQRRLTALSKMREAISELED